MRVLVVDDEKDICSLVCRILDQNGAQCHSSHYIKGALQKIDNNSYNLFLLDINLPDGTGFDLIPAIFRKDPEARVVILSAYDDFMYKEKAAEMGVENFISKPFSKNDILSLIDV